MKIKLFLIISLILILINIPTICFGEIKEENIIESQQSLLGISDFLNDAKEYSNAVYKDINFDELFKLAIVGKINNKLILNNILKAVGNESIESVSVILSVIIIIIIHSILKSISDGLENKSISQIIYYIQYILIVTLIMQNFSSSIVLIKDSIQNLVGFMNSLIPILITLMLTTGNIVSASIIQPIILFVITFAGNFINNFIIPLVLVSTSLGIISKVSDKIQIDKLSKFIKSSVVWIIGMIMTAFVGLLSIEGNLSSSVDGITAKTTKAAVSSFIPVVGKILRRCS